MLNKQELAGIKARFEAGGCDRDLRIEGEHINDDGQAISLGWHVLGDSPGIGTIAYARHTTFEAATFLVHLPVDMANLLEDADHYHLVLAGVLAGDEAAIQIARELVFERVRQERETSDAD
jgi:hypothetical protein